MQFGVAPKDYFAKLVDRTLMVSSLNVNVTAANPPRPELSERERVWFDSHPNVADDLKHEREQANTGTIFNLKDQIVIAQHMLFYASEYQGIGNNFKTLLQYIDHQDFLAAIRFGNEAAQKEKFPELLLRCNFRYEGCEGHFFDTLSVLFSLPNTLVRKIRKLPDRFFQYLNELISYWSTYHFYIV